MSKQKKSHRGRRFLGIVVLVLAVAYAVIALLPRPQNFALETNPMRMDGELPILIAHGGGNREFPDNTLEAFYNAYSVDPRVMLETDVSITADGVVLLSHDTRIDRKTNRTGAIIDWNYSDLIAQKVDFGYTNQTRNQELVEGSERVKFTTDDGRQVTPMDVTYPEGVSVESLGRDPEVFLATTLEDLLVCFPENRINVEIKQSGEEGMKCLSAVLELLKKYDAWDRVVLASFHNEIYAEYQRLQQSGEVPESFMCSPGLGNAAIFYVLQLLELDALYSERTTVLQLPTCYEDIEVLGIRIPINLATSRLVSAAHDHNMAVHYWTINDRDEMRMLIALGADGIMSDYPHRLQEVYQEYQAQ
ncbi:MAG: glycerophosphodiester phosphodiesterase family protein [Aristaeellaceae bacterium]